MIKKNQAFLNFLNVLSDALIIVLSMIGAFLIRFEILNGHITVSLYGYCLLSAVYMPIQILVFKYLRLYEPHRKRRIYKELAAMFFGTLICFSAALVSLYMFKYMDYSRIAMGIFFILENAVLGIKRIALRLGLRYFRKKGFNQKHVVIIGNGETAKHCYKEICRSPELGYAVHGYVADNNDWEEIKWLGSLRDFEHVIEEENPDEVIATFDTNEHEYITEIIDLCETNGIRFSLIPFYSKFMSAQPQIDSLNGIPILNLREIPLDHVWNAAVKRTCDVVCSIILLILTSPIMLVCAVCVKLSSPGPILFKQERIGYAKKPFYMYKFRSMRVNSDQDTGWTTNSDPRKTKVGAFIRKYSIDELPQFFNVLIGDMSLVGPRPEVPYFVEQFKEQIPKYLLRQQVRPGITGWAQVNGLRGNTSIEERVRYDRWYIENWSIGLDIVILLKTLFGGFKNNEKLAEKETVSAVK